MPRVFLMPLARNLPEGKEGWLKKECPLCGCACWESNIVREQGLRKSMSGVCTECGIRASLTTVRKPSKKAGSNEC